MIRRAALTGVGMCLSVAHARAQPVDDDAPAGIYGVTGDEGQGQDQNQENETLPSSDRADAVSDGATAHTVRKGDTLWDISREHFRDPWRWPKVWSLNPEIANPHWIFPGQIIRLRDPNAGSGAVAGPPVPAPAATEATAPPPPPSVPSDTEDLRQLGFVDEGALKAAGVINGSLEEKILLATGDHAYVEFPPGPPPTAGARYSVYQVDTAHPVREPHSQMVLGYLVHVYGELQIDSLTDRPIASARLVSLAGPVERGYRVGPIIRQLKSVKPKHNQSDMTARIVASVEPNLMIANQMFVVLNRGRRHGVAVGNRFLVLRQGDGLKRIMESWDTSDHLFPPHAIAEIIAVDVQDETTVGWISRGTRELHVGDVADLRRGY